MKTKIDFECTIYLWAPIDSLIVVEFLDDNSPCDNRNSFIMIRDYWSWYEQVYPMDAKIYQQTKRICNDDYWNRKKFQSKQNGAMITYRYRRIVDEKFKFRLQFIPNNEPCIIFVAGSETTHGEYRLKNNDKNCALYIVQSPKWNKGNFLGIMLTIDEFDVGDTKTKTYIPYPYYVSIVTLVVLKHFFNTLSSSPLNSVMVLIILYNLVVLDPVYPVIVRMKCKHGLKFVMNVIFQIVFILFVQMLLYV